MSLPRPPKPHDKYIPVKRAEMKSYNGLSSALSLSFFWEGKFSKKLKSDAPTRLGLGCDVTPLAPPPASLGTDISPERAETISAYHLISIALWLERLREREVNYPIKNENHVFWINLLGTGSDVTPLISPAPAPHDTDVPLKSSEMSSVHQGLSNALSLLCIRALDVHNFGILAVLVAVPPHRYNCSIEQAAICPTK